MNIDEWQRIRALRGDGTPISTIARIMGMSRSTIRRALTSQAPPGGSDGSLFAQYADPIRRHLAAHPDASAAQVADAIGWTHSRSSLLRSIARIRAETTATHGATPEVPGGKPQPKVAAPDTDPPAATRQPDTLAATRRRGAASDIDDPTRSADALAVDLHSPGDLETSTSFVGRRAELARLQTLLGSHRLVTITGPGGVGKTRLAHAATRQFRRAFDDGTRFIELAALRSPQLLAQAILEGLDVPGRDRAGTTAEDALAAHLRDRRMLLVLDNCEQLVAACAVLVRDLLEQAPQLTILITSREVLGTPSEYVLPLAPLPVRPADSDGADDAVELFEQRARAVLGTFTLTDENRESVRRACLAVDGVPLAIELACARLPALSVRDLAERLTNRLDLLTTGNRGGPDRHQSMTTTLQWSHDHCSRDEQLLWSRAAHFTDGFDLTMLERICVDDDLPSARLLDAVGGLVAKSVVQREEVGDQVRFRMLQIVREFGLGMLDEAESQLLNRRLLSYVGDRLATAQERWKGPEQLQINAWFRANRANIRRCLQWAVEQAPDSDEVALAAEAIAGPWFLWAGGMAIDEYRMWLQRFADELPDSSPARGRVLATLALITTLQGDRDAADVALRTAGAIAREHQDSATAAFLVHTSGLRDYFSGAFERSEPLLLDAFRRYADDPPRGALQSALEVHLGMHYTMTGEHDRAAAYFRRAYGETPDDAGRWFRAYAGFGLGTIALLEGDAQAAHRFALESMRLIRDFDDELGSTLVIELLGWSNARLGNYERAATILGSVSRLWRSVGRPLYDAPGWLALHETYEREASEALGAAAFQRLLGDGAKMSMSAVIALALDEQPDADEPEQATQPLSRREREIAELVAQGMSNRQIAAQLVLSPRTVEGHVERVLHKLLLNSRTEVAAALRSHTG